MKEFNLFNNARWLLMVALAAIVSTNVGAVNVTTTFTSSSWTDANSGWTSNTNGSGFEADRGVASNGVDGACTSKTSYSGGVYSITIVASSNAANNSITISIGSQVIATKSIANANHVTYTYDYRDYANIAQLSGAVKLTVNHASSTTWVKSITISYATSAYTVSFNAGSGSCASESLTEGGAGYGITLPSASPSASCAVEGWKFAGWKRTSAQTETSDIPVLYTAGSAYHPESNEALYAVYNLGDYYMIDFESALNTYTDWSFTNIAKDNGTIAAYAGNCYGKTGGTETAAIKTANKLNPTVIRFYVSKQSDNKTESTWYVQTSSNGSNWTNITSQDAKGMSKGEWVEVSADLSAYSDVYVRIYYDGSTAVRNIDNIVISCAIFNSNPTCCATVVNLANNSPSNGSVSFNVASVPTCSETASDRQATMTITPNTGYYLSAFNWSTGAGTITPGVSPAISTSSATGAQVITLSYGEEVSGTSTANATFTAKDVTAWTWKQENPGQEEIVIPATVNLYVGQQAWFNLKEYTPSDVIDGKKGYSATYLTDYLAQDGKGNTQYKTRAKAVIASTTLTFTSTSNGSVTQVITISISALPSVTFIDLIHGESSSAVSANVDGTDKRIVHTTKPTPTHSDVADPGEGYNACERNHLHLVGWIDKAWVDDGHQQATHSEISSAGAGNFYAPGADMDLVAKNGKTFYAVWAKEAE